MAWANGEKEPLGWIICLLFFVLFLIFINRSALAFGGDDHFNICEESLKSIKYLSIKFGEKSIKEICQSDVDTDNLINFGISEVHFDNEKLREGSLRLIALKTEVINAIKSSNRDKARKITGQGLHTLQDFFAHTNWVETRAMPEGMDLGNWPPLKNPQQSDRFCTDDGESLLNEKEKTSTPLTSGYWPGGFLGACDPIPFGKCYHGHIYNIVDNPGGLISCLGINKDEGSQFARIYAKQFSDNYVGTKIIDGTKISYDSIHNFMSDKNGTLGFVIDQVFSPPCYGYRSQVPPSVVTILNNISTVDEPIDYLLQGIPFNLSPAYKTTDRLAFLSKVLEMPILSSTDTMQPFYGALINAISASRPYSTIYLYTDSTTIYMDRDKISYLYELAKYKNIKISAVNIPCKSYTLSTTTLQSDIDPNLLSLAESTGGQFFSVEDDHLGEFSEMMYPSLSNQFVTIARVKRNLFGSETQSISIPVDTTITRLMLSIIADTDNQVKVIRPSGVEVAPDDLQIKSAIIASGRYLIIENPESGKWHVSISGAGDFILTAQANSPLDLYTFRFQEEYRWRNIIYDPIPGQPIVGTTPISEANLIGPIETAIFRLIDDEGNTLQFLDLEERPSKRFIGPVSLPSVPFRIAVNGVDTNGAEYERLFPNLFQVQSIEVKVDPITNFLKLPTGATKTFKFNVHNLGDAGTFQIMVHDNLEFAQSPNPASLTLGSGETQSFTVDVVVPAGVADSPTLLLTAIATSTSDPNLANSATVTADIYSPGDLNKDGQVDSTDYLIFISAFSTCNGSPNYNPDADYDGDSCITFVDYQTWYQFYLNQ